MWSIYYVQGPNHTRLRYIAQGISMQNHAWFFDALFMDLDASMGYLGTNTWHCSLKCHSQGPLTPTQSRMILRNHTYLKVYKCWRILPILKTPTIKCLAIIFKKYFNFQWFYIVSIIIWWFLGWKNFTPSKLGETGLQKMQMANLFLEKNMEK